MHPIGKIFAGLILILVGLALFAVPALQIPGYVNWLDNFIVIVTGSIPILLIIIGLFVVWLEADELKVSKEFEAEDDKNEEIEKIKGKVKENPKTKRTTVKRKYKKRKKSIKKEASSQKKPEKAVDEM